MSLYFCTNSIAGASAVMKRWQSLFDSVDVRPLPGGAQLVTSPGFRRASLIEHSDGRVTSVVFGMMFCRDGYGIDCLSRHAKGSFLTGSELPNVWGHYSVLQFDNNEIRLTNDPVGMLGVFWTQHQDEFAFTNDLPAMRTAGFGRELSRSGAQQFVLSESTVGRDTLFEGVYRMEPGMQLRCGGSDVEFIPINHAEFSSMSFQDYLGRVEEYFEALNHVIGRVSVEVSAGFDTRLIASAAAGRIQGGSAIGNTNTQDRGVDEYIGNELAKMLDLPYMLITHADNHTRSDLGDVLLLHATTGARNVIRSAQWLPITQEKFSVTEFLLGGYGGEVARAKYTNYRTLNEMTAGYYGKGLVLDRLGIRYEFTEAVSSQLAEVYHPLLTGMEFSTQANIIYAMDRMRIWGGARVLTMSLYGQSLHPFMDWYLLEPLLSWDIEELKAGKFQRRLIAALAPQALELPINPHWAEMRRGNKRALPRLVNRYEALALRAANAVRTRIRKATVPDVKPRPSPELQHVVGIRTMDLLRLPSADFYTRMVTLQVLLDQEG